MEDRKISEREGIEIITSMIARTKERYMLGDGNIILMWGYLSVGISILIWTLLAITQNPIVNWLWFLIWIVGGIATPIMAKKKAVKKGAKTYTDITISRIWDIVGYSAIGFTMVCLFLLLSRGINAWSAMLIFALTVVPIAEIASGIVLNESSYIKGGAFGLLIGIFTTGWIAGGMALNADWFMPVFIAAFVCMMIIPGHIVNLKAKKSNERT